MALIDSLDRENRTPLHYAAAKGSLEVREESPLVCITDNIPIYRDLSNTPLLPSIKPPF